MKANRLFLVSSALLIGASGCGLWSKPAPAPRVTTVTENPIPGTVDHAWEAPIYDQVDVPAQLDPNGITYRPRHSTLVEVLPGRVQEVQYPDTRSFEVQPSGDIPTDGYPVDGGAQ